MQETDPQLIRAAAAGDLEAFEQIVRLHQQPVWRFLRRLLGDGVAAEDVTQETFLRVYRRLPSFTFQSTFSTWLYQVARNAGIDELRARQRRERLAGALRPAAPATSPGHARVEIDAALAALPVDLRETLVLVEVLGLRYAEAGTVLGVPLGTVKSRVHAARVRLARWARADESPGHASISGVDDRLDSAAETGEMVPAAEPDGPGVPVEPGECGRDVRGGGMGGERAAGDGGGATEGASGEV